MINQTDDRLDPAYRQLFAPLGLLLARSQCAYEAYLERRVYLNALRLLRINRRIVRLLHGQAGWVPSRVMPDAVLLLNHYECWLIQFGSHRRQIQPALGDPFIFPAIDPQNAFPKGAVARLLEHARSLTAIGKD